PGVQWLAPVDGVVVAEPRVERERVLDVSPGLEIEVHRRAVYPAPVALLKVRTGITDRTPLPFGARPPPGASPRWRSRVRPRSPALFVRCGSALAGVSSARKKVQMRPPHPTSLLSRAENTILSPSSSTPRPHPPCSASARTDPASSPAATRTPLT